MLKYKNSKLALFIFLLLVMLILTAYCIKPAYADGTGTLAVGAEYSDGITANEKDNFEITYSNETGASTTITVNAYDARTDTINIEVQPGTYTITKIVYDGTNDEITEAGYGIGNVAYVAEDDFDMIQICIGAESIGKLESRYKNAVIVDDEHDENGNRIVFHDEIGTYVYEVDEEGNPIITYLEETGPSSTPVTGDDTEGEESSGSYESSDVYSDNWSDEIPAQTPNGQEPIVEYYETADDEADQRNSSPIVTIVFFATIGIAGVCAIYIAHKKGTFK